MTRHRHAPTLNCDCGGCPDADLYRRILPLFRATERHCRVAYMQSTDPCEMLPSPNEMVQHLQADAEMHRDVLSRAHDELGGLMISAVMDLASAESHMGLNEDGHERLTRARQTLSTAIDFERRMVESLRPTLLDNFGLFAALRWQVDRDCRHAGILCTEVYPSKEIDLRPQASIALFRIVQDGLNVAIRQSSVRSVNISIELGDGAIAIQVAHDGEGGTSSAQNRLDAFALCSMSHRIQGLAGSLTLREQGDGRTAYAARIPLVSILRN
jgi:signal transduction histidine kinase